ncbi:hypothetical protein ACFQ1L_36295 [Phytohabitans flavus]|uniref:hypothetical protein n=1 Tax=Phytohabitans flavus TaxID=1076124 RepID=UPI001566BF26|nr:hypothetical protein [Phytohabitans flavus]
MAGGIPYSIRSSACDQPGTHMAWSPNLDDITRILDLIGTPLALEVLDGLGHHQSTVASVPPNCDPTIIQAALEVLFAAGAIESYAGGNLLVGPVGLTQAGERLLDALRIVDRASDIKYFPASYWRREFRHEVDTLGRRGVQFAENLDSGARFGEP